MNNQTRFEHDSLGLIEVPAEAYYGAQTARAVRNFPISGVTLSSMPFLIRALAQVKMAAAQANAEQGNLPPEKRDAILSACDEILQGKHDSEFVVDVFQGGAGTSTNMNINEVLANRASELLGGVRGEARLVHPLDDVNRSQSTNDAYATALRLSVIGANRQLRHALERLATEFEGKAQEFKTIEKLGRTQLQDAVPMTLGQEFGAFYTTLTEDCERLDEASNLFLEVNLGGTAIGSSVAASSSYQTRVIELLSRNTQLPLVRSKDLFEASWDTGAFMLYMSVLKRIASKLSKIANDFRLLSSGPRGGVGEIVLPPLQPGSSLMPGKVNPVAAEALNQVCFHVYGLETTVGLAAQAGQLQLNAMEPVIAYCVHSAIQLLTNGIQTFSATCVVGVRADIDRCERNLKQSTAFVTELVSSIGYDAAVKIAKEHIAQPDKLAEHASGSRQRLNPL